MTLRFKSLEILFVLFMAVAMVRIVPFTPHQGIFDPSDIVQVGVPPRQIAFVILFLGIGLIALRRMRLSDVVLPLPLLLLIGFAALSLSWSAVPLVGFRRLALTLLVTLTILLTTVQLRPRTTLDLLRHVTVGLALASLLAGLLYPTGAIHMPGDPQPAIVGSWRGVFYHKNHAGAAIGLGVVLAADALLRERRALLLLPLLVAVVMLVLTRSKTSIVAAALSVVILLAFRGAAVLAGRNPAQGALMRWSIVLGGLTALIAAWFATDMQHYVLDPDAFTGRGELWAIVIELIEKRPMLGYGYESVFQAGDSGVMSQISNFPWLRFAPHSHNGLLDLLVTTGLVGVVLYTWALVVDPWRRIAVMPESVRDAWQPIIAALLCFAFIQSLMEGKSFSGDSAQWAILVIVLGISLRLTAIMRQDGAANEPSTLETM